MTVLFYSFCLCTGYGKESTDSEGKCDLFNGDWIPYQSEPFYTNNSCSFIEEHQNCLRNGRPDRRYLYWRWKPHGCDLPRLDPERFLDLMRNKSWALIGDSISRNHVQSLLCILSMVKLDKVTFIIDSFGEKSILCSCFCNAKYLPQHDWIEWSI